MTAVLAVCPDCDGNAFHEVTDNWPFDYLEVTLTANYPMLQCVICGSTIMDIRGESAQLDAVAKHLNNKKDR